MDLALENKLALVSASSAGIGKAIAEALAREGARVGARLCAAPHAQKLAKLGSARAQCVW